MKRFLLLAVAALFVLSCKQGTVGPEKKGQALAKVGGSAITAEDVKKEFDMLPAQLREFFIGEGGMEGLVEELVKKELLYQEALKKGLERGEEYKRRIEDFRKRLLVELLLEKEIEEKAKVTEKEIKEFYEKNKAEFVMEVPGKGKESVAFERLKDLIERRLTAEKQKEAFESYIEALKKTYKVELDSEAVKKAFGNIPQEGGNAKDLGRP